jgi:hypothetical protein
LIPPGRLCTSVSAQPFRRNQIVRPPSWIPGPKTDRALPGIAHVAAVDLVVGPLLQPVHVKAKPQVLPQFVGSRVVDVKSLPWLHVSNSEPHEWVVVGGIPEIMHSCAELCLPVKDRADLGRIRPRLADRCLSSPGIDSFGISTNSCTRGGDLVDGRVEGEMAATDNVNLR